MSQDAQSRVLAPKMEENTSKDLPSQLLLERLRNELAKKDARIKELEASQVERKPQEDHEEYQYLHLINKIILFGCLKPNRTGVDTKSLFGAQMRFDLTKGFPLLTTKRVFWRGVVEEILWFIRGSTNAKDLTDKKVHIWDKNGTREFLDGRGLTENKEGDLGPIYGFQWRHFGAEYRGMDADYADRGVDQLQDIICKIKNRPEDRTIVMCAWNAKDLSKMALPPCHCLVQFYVAEGSLSCQLYQRSADIGLGVPFNIASYALLTHMIAHVCQLDVGDFVHTLGDAHVYVNHIDALKEQMTRVPKQFPSLVIKRSVQCIDDFTTEDFKMENYVHHPKIQMEMAV